MFVKIALLGMVAVMALAACGTASTPTAAPATAAPATTAPTTAPATAAATTAPATAAATATTAATMAPTASGPTATAAPVVISSTCPAGTTFTLGMILVGPYNDSGWSQATYEGGEYAVSKVPNTCLIYIDNGFNHQGSTPEQLADDLVAKGANLIIFNSDDFKDDSNNFAKDHPTIPTIMLSGDQSWAQGEAYLNLPNMVNIMGQMEYMKMLAGCAAAMTTKTGKIGYLGPLINDETRRLSSSAYLGAKYCWTNVLKKDPSQLTFSVIWIGYWYNEPGTTLDPTKVADNFFNTGYDVVMSGIDTDEAVTEAKKETDEGNTVYAVGYDYKGNCSAAPSVCLGVPYFNWGPGIETQLKAAVAGTFKQSWNWLGPDWTNINDPDNSNVGFVKGQALSTAASAAVDTLTTYLAAGNTLWVGPLNLQDGTSYLAAGTTATQLQIWYLPQLLQGMNGNSK
jgi:simple sugar transport system substrate-binding protein